MKTARIKLLSIFLIILLLLVGFLIFITTKMPTTATILETPTTRINIATTNILAANPEIFYQTQNTVGFKLPNSHLMLLTEDLQNQKEDILLILDASKIIINNPNFYPDIKEDEFTFLTNQDLKTYMPEIENLYPNGAYIYYTNL